MPAGQERVEPRAGERGHASLDFDLGFFLWRFHFVSYRLPAPRKPGGRERALSGGKRERLAGYQYTTVFSQPPVFSER